MDQAPEPAAVRVPSSGPTFWAVVLPIAAICLFGGAQIFLPDRWSWTRHCKVDPVDDPFALANYGAVLVAAIVGVGLGVQSGFATFSARIVVGTLLAFALSLGANAAYTHFKPKIAAMLGPKRKREPEPEPETEPDSEPEPEPEPEPEEEAPDALAVVAAAQCDSDGPPLEDGPALDVPVERGSYESHMDPGGRAIGAHLGDACITGCSLLNIQ